MIENSTNMTAIIMNLPAYFVEQTNSSCIFGHYLTLRYALMIAVICAAVFIMPRLKLWVNFARRWKWFSRGIMFVCTLAFLLFAIALPSSFGACAIPGKISPESPFLTSTAIKLGLYGLYFEHEVASNLPLEKQDMVKCVDRVSFLEAQDYQNKCGNDRSCFENIPPMTRETILAKIKEIQANPKVGDEVCKNVDVSKL